MRTLALLYGLLAYLLTGMASLYFAGFLFDLGVPTLFPPPGEFSVQALWIDLALIGLFGVQHSVMARDWFKRRWTRLMPPPIERSTYVLASNLALAGLVALWQPLGRPETQLPVWFRVPMWGVTLLGVVILLAASWQIDHFALMGLRQVWDHYHQRRPEASSFRVEGLYRYVRHPLMAGLLIVLWAPPVATPDRLLLAAGLTGYILLARRFEERDLVAEFGSVYESYRRQVPALIPWRGRFVMIAIGEHPDGVVLPVRAQPGARKAGVKGEQGGALKLAVTAPPEDGRANEALVELLHELLGVKRSQVELISGPTSREKKFLIRGLPREELAARVAALL